MYYYEFTKKIHKTVKISGWYAKYTLLPVWLTMNESEFSFLKFYNRFTQREWGKDFPKGFPVSDFSVNSQVRICR